MRTILILNDTMRRDYLPVYHPDSDVIAPAICEFAKDSIVFEQHFTGSMPCMPARRDLFTGRLNFLERSWGPIEIFDQTLPKELEKKQIRSHMITDHAHYFRIGGENYCQQFSTYEFFRGQESDPWISLIDDPEIPQDYYGEVKRQYECNRSRFTSEQEFPSVKCFQAAEEWIKNNAGATDFLLMVETFDPHEPFDLPKEYLDLYHDTYTGPRFDLPKYKKITDETQEALQHLKNRYKGLITMTDHHFGSFLQTLKDYDMYEDTMIIMTTDHGYCLGEREFLGKNYMPYYNDLTNIPLIIHMPKGFGAGTRRTGITQNIDIMPTILDYENMDCPSSVSGVSLKPLIEENRKIKEYALYGAHGLSVNIFDGRYTYFRAPRRKDCCYEYTTSLTTIRDWLGKDQAQEIEMGRFLPEVDFPVYKVPARKNAIVSDPSCLLQDALYDIQTDYAQRTPLQDEALLIQMCELLRTALKEHHAPKEQFLRLGL